MYRSCPTLLLAVLALAPTLSAQSHEPRLRPISDFFFEEQEDGSILTADALGTHHFPSWLAYVQSDFFQQHGARCGSERLAYPLALGTSSDCSSTFTNIEAQYAPAAGPDRRSPSAVFATSGLFFWNSGLTL